MIPEPEPVVLTHAQEARLEKIAKEDPEARVVAQSSGEPVVERSDGGRRRVTMFGRLVALPGR